MRVLALFAAAASLALHASAQGSGKGKTITVTVGGNTTDNATSVFDPNEVAAALGDTVVFNFTMGNHSVTQSLFASPCLPANQANSTINGFDSGPRNTANGTVFTQLEVTITPETENMTLWFYDINLCGDGGVGGINVNDSDGSFENFDAFQRNAERLNGSAGDDTPTTSTTRTRTSTSPSATSHDNGALDMRHLTYGTGLAAVPLALLALML